MNLQETRMAAMKLSIFFFTLSALLGAYHARHLHDGFIYQSFDRRSHVKTADVIQMVTGEEEPQSTPPPPPPSQAKTDYGGAYLEGRPAPRRPPSDGETIHGGVNPETPLPPKVALPEVQTGCGGDKLEGTPSPVGPVPITERTYGRDNPNAPPTPQVAPSRGQTTYGGDNPNSNSHTMLFGGSSCGDSSSTFGGRRNRIPLRAPAVTTDIQIKQDEDDQLLSIASHWLLSYTTRVFNW